MKVIEDSSLYYDVIYKLKPMYQDEFRIRYIIFRELKNINLIPENYRYFDESHFVIATSISESNYRMEEVELITQIKRYEIFLEPVVDKKQITKAILTLI